MDINDYILRKLNNHVSADLDTFCTAPWYNVYVAPDKKIAPCCNFTPDGFDYTYNQLDEYFNSSQLKKLRRDLYWNLARYATFENGIFFYISIG